MKKFIYILSIVSVVGFVSCGGGESKEAKELFQKILTTIGIPPEVIRNICQGSNSSDICEGMTLTTQTKEDKKNKSWQKIEERGEGQYLLETTTPCEPILLQLQDNEIVYDSGEFILKFAGVESGVEKKELSILEAMIDATYLSENSVIYIKDLNNSEAQNNFYATLYRDLKKNINTLRVEGLTKVQSIRGTLKEMADELILLGIDKALPTRINNCEDNSSCISNEMNSLSAQLIIDPSEAGIIFEREKDNDSSLRVKEVVCEKEYPRLASDLVLGHVIFKDENNKIKPIPLDAQIRLAPKQFQNDEDSWNNVACKIDEDGNFGDICYIDHDERAIRDAFHNENTRYQIVVFKNHVKPQEVAWNCGEDIYKYVSQEVNPPDNSPKENWKNIEVFPYDYQDRSQETCNDD